MDCLNSESLLCTMDFGPLLRNLFGPNVSPALVEVVVDVASIITVSTFCLLIVSRYATSIFVDSVA